MLALPIPLRCVHIQEFGVYIGISRTKYAFAIHQMELDPEGSTCMLIEMILKTPR